MTATISLSSGLVSSVPFIDLVPQHNAIADEVMAAVQKVFAEQRFILGEKWLLWKMKWRLIAMLASRLAATREQMR